MKNAELEKKLNGKEKPKSIVGAGFLGGVTGGVVSGAGYFSWLTMTGSMPISFASAVQLITLTAAANPAIVVVGGGAVLGGIAFASYNVIQNYRNTTNKEDKSNVQQDKLVSIVTKFKGSNLNNPVELNITQLTDSGIKAFCKSLNESKTDEIDNLPVIKTIKIDSRSITQDQIGKLLANNLGGYSTQHLEIKRAKHIPNLLMMLSKAVAEGSFRHLNHLDLSKNAILPNYLIKLSEMGRSSSLDKLILSRNNLSTVAHERLGPALGQFYANLYRNFPKLKTLEIKRAKLNDEELMKLKPLFQSMTSLENFDISGNKFSLKIILALVKSEDFLTNLSIKSFVIDYNGDVEIKQALDKRDAARNKLIDAFKDTSNEWTGNILLDVLNGLRSEESGVQNALNLFIETMISDKLSQKQQKIKWKLWLNESLHFKEEGALTEVEFNQFKKNGLSYELPTLESILLDEKLDQLQNPIRNNKAEFILNEPNADVLINASVEMKQILNSFTVLAEKTHPPIVERISINHGNLAMEDMSKLLEAGVGRYNTKILELRNNNLTDEMLVDLARLPLDAFAQLKHLDLTGNKITVQGLESLAKFCSRSGIEHLTLSENPLSPRNAQEAQLLLSFFRLMPKIAPNLKVINIKNIGLTNSTVQLVRPLLTNLSMIESVSFSQLTVKHSAAIRKLVEDPAFQSNLHLKHIMTGYGSVHAIKVAVDAKKANHKLLIDNISEAESIQPITCTLLNRFLQNRNKPNLVLPIETLLKTKDATNVSAWETLQQMADKLRLRGFEKVSNDEHYASFKADEPTLSEALVSLKISQLKNAQNKSIVNFTINEEGAPVKLEKDNIIAELESVLIHFDEAGKFPLLKRLTLNHIDLTMDEFLNLIVAGIGQYKTEVLELRHNHINDDFIKGLSKLDVDCFKGLKCLDLSHNQITVKGLADLSLFCGKVGIVTLKLNHNPINPDASNQEEVQALYQFALTAHQKISTLIELEMQNIGLNDNTLCLLQPLFYQLSLLERIDISHNSITNNKSIEIIIKDECFKANLTLKTLNTGKNNIRFIKQHLNEKSNVDSQVQLSFLPEGKNLPIICVLLSKLIQDPSTKWPKPFQDWLEKETLKISGLFFATNLDKLKFMAMQLRYFRERVALHNPEFIIPSMVSKKEYLALKSNTLIDYWPDTYLSQVNEAFKRQISNRYSAMCIMSQPFKALILDKYKVHDEIIALCWGEDDTIRVINETRKLQCVFHRYAIAHALDASKIYGVVIDEAHHLVFDANGNVSIQQHGVGQIASIIGAESHVKKDNPLNIKLNPRAYKVVHEISALMPTPQSTQSTSVLPGYDRHKQAQPASESECAQNMTSDDANKDKTQSKGNTM